MISTDEKTERIVAERQFLITIGMPDSERVLRLAALEKLLDDGWPSAHINNKMLNRAMQGLVPPYNGEQSLRDYKAKWST